MLRLVTFLGIVDYKECSYVLNGKCSPKTRWSDVGILFTRNEPAHIIVLGTDEAEKKWFGDPKAYASEIRNQINIPLAIDFVRIPKGQESAERWEIFNQLVQALEPQAYPGESEAPSRVILNITHGFRSQPFFAASAVAFAQSQRRRTNSHDAVPIQIYYGAFDNKDDKDIVPIWELTQFIDVVAWDAAIDGLMRYGRADDLERLTVAHRKQSPQFPSLERFAETTRRFADGLATARIPEVTTKLARELAHAVEHNKADIVQWIPPLAKQLDELSGWAASIDATSIISQEGIERSLALAKLYLHLQRYAEATITLRETLLTAHTLKAVSAADVKHPHDGEPFDKQRRKQEKQWKGGPVTTLLNPMSKLRNDLEHGGFQHAARTAHQIRKELEGQYATISGALCPTAGIGKSPIPAPPARPAVFLNITHHSVATWSAEQLASARRLGLGEPEDLPGLFPRVDPHESEEKIAELTLQLADREVAQGARGAVVTGEYALTLALVEELRARGIRCFTATTNREAQTVIAADGTVRKESVFKFVRWREFRH